MNPILAGAIDIGNTRIKILADGQFFAGDLNTNWQEPMHKYLWNFSGKQVLFGVSSVNPEAYSLLEGELKLGGDLQLDMKLRSQAPSGNFERIALPGLHVDIDGRREGSALSGQADGHRQGDQRRQSDHRKNTDDEQDPFNQCHISDIICP